MRYGPEAAALAAIVVVVGVPLALMTYLGRDNKSCEQLVGDAFERGRQRGIVEERAQKTTVPHCEQLLAASKAWDLEHPWFYDGGDGR